MLSSSALLFAGRHKRANPFAFVFVPGPTYTAALNEAVWTSFGTNGSPPAVYHVDTVFGPVLAGCIVQYVEIDDQVDDRRNFFLIDNDVIYEIPQGMVSSGSFVVPRDGVLNYFVNDSIGLYVDTCSAIATGVPKETALPTNTPTLISSATSTPSAAETPTATALASATSTLPGTLISTSTSTPAVNSTGTPATVIPGNETPLATETAVSPPSTTPLPPVVATPVPAITPTPTKHPFHSKTACTRINFEVSGDTARQGVYELVEADGRILATWQAENGWQDSGWMNVKITYPSVYVGVSYLASSMAAPVEMRILNPAPGTNSGWLTEDMCHAIEVAWPANQ